MIHLLSNLVFTNCTLIGPWKSKLRRRKRALSTALKVRENKMEVIKIKKTLCPMVMEKVIVKMRSMIRMRDAKSNSWGWAPNFSNSKKEAASHKYWKISSTLPIKLQWNLIPSTSLSNSVKPSMRKRTTLVKSWFKVLMLWRMSAHGQSKWRRSILIPPVITC